MIHDRLGVGSCGARRGCGGSGSVSTACRTARAHAFLSRCAKVRVRYSKPREHDEDRGKTVHSVAGGARFICLEGALTLELIRAMAEKRPERVVCLDEGFAGSDQLTINAVQIVKTKGVTSFRTV